MTHSYLQLQIAGASLFGILLSKFDRVTCLKFAAGLMLCSLPVVVITFCLLHLWFLVGSQTSFLDSTPQVFLTWLTNKLSTGVLDHNKTSQTYCKTSNGEPLTDDDNKGKFFYLD